jgi:hypothetical protein
MSSDARLLRIAFGSRKQFRDTPARSARAKKTIQRTRLGRAAGSAISSGTFPERRYSRTGTARPGSWPARSTATKCGIRTSDFERKGSRRLSSNHGCTSGYAYRRRHFVTALVGEAAVAAHGRGALDRTSTWPMPRSARRSTARSRSPDRSWSLSTNSSGNFSAQRKIRAR